MFFYNTVISLYFATIQIVGLFNPKIKLLARAHRDWKKDLAEKMSSLSGRKITWVHCASVGEFEQGRPLIESIKKKYPSQKIVLSFFSPSGYELHKNYPLADAVLYFPKDTQQNAEHFIESINPSTVIFVKYEFWLHFLFTLQKKKIPTYLVSAVIKKHQPFFKWYGKPFVKALHVYEQIFVQDEGSLQLLKQLGVQNAVISGDTRVDRVISISASSKDLPAIQEFVNGARVIIAGSTWQIDESYLISTFIALQKKFPDLKLILTPHEVDPKNIERLQNDLHKAHLDHELYTSGKEFKGHSVLVIDTIGLLSSLYKYGQIAYVGGGFSNGIHNILEPAAYSLPVIFGPKHQKFVEAQELLKNGGAVAINNAPELSDALGKYLENRTQLEKAGKLCRAYIAANEGATEKILSRISTNYTADL